MIDVQLGPICRTTVLRPVPPRPHAAAPQNPPAAGAQPQQQPQSQQQAQPGNVGGKPI